MGAPGRAHALVEGNTPTHFRSYQVFGDARTIGNTLMANPWPTMEVNTVLLPESSANLGGVPDDATPVAAYLWWSGSLGPGQGRASVDDDALLIAPDGSTHVAVADNWTSGGVCEFITTFPDGPLSFYYCRADVTAFVSAHPGMFSWNGSWTVGDVIADPGHMEGDNCAAWDWHCQAKYAGWTMIFVYDSPSSTLQRDIKIYDGFVHADEVAGPQASIGVFQFEIGGFLVGSPAEAELAFFGMEGDAFFGAPDYCPTCQDFFQVNGAYLHDPFNPWGNVYNSTPALGFDLDEYDIGTAGGGLGILDTGDTTATCRTGTGDGTVKPDYVLTGETIFLGWVALKLNRPSPNFRGPGTKKLVDPPTAATGQTLFYTVDVANQGSLVATNVVLSDALPAGTAYEAGSLRVDGAACTDAADGDPCTVSGGTLTVSLGTVPHTGDNDRRVTFRALLTGTGVGETICNVAGVVSTQTPTASEIGPACVSVDAVTIGQPQKVVADLTGGVVGPDDVLQYTITIPGDPASPVSGLTFEDDVPPHVQMLYRTSPGGGAVDESTTSGGAYGNGRVRFTNVSVPAGGTATITFTVQVDGEAEFAADGVSAGAIHGTSICNQGSVQAGFLPAPAPTDDPGTPAAQDGTCVAVTYAPLLGGSSKQVVDDDGGPLEPGDTLTYTIAVVNSGNRTGTVSLDDAMPPGVEGFALLTPLLGAVFEPPPAGANGTGRLTVSGMAVAAGSTATIRFRVTVRGDVPDGLLIANQALMSVAEREAENRTLASPGLVVYARPELGGLTKAVVDTNGAPVEPGDALRYDLAVTNEGNRPATSVVVTDVVDANLTAIVVTAGAGTWDAATRTITWTLPGPLAVGETATFAFTAVVVSPLANGTVIANAATIDSAEPAPAAVSDDPATPTVDDPTLVTVVSAPRLDAAEKTVIDLDGGAPEPGDVLEYAIRVRNTGSAPATGVTVTDPVDGAHLADVAPLDGGSVSGATITWVLGALAPGEERTVRFRAVIRSPMLDGTVIDNQAALAAVEVPGTFPTDDPTTPAPDDPTRVVVSSRADLSASTLEVEDLNGGAAQPGDTLRYTLRVRNVGTSPALGLVGVVVVDPAFAAVVAETGGAWDPGTRVVTWALPGPLDPGAPELVLTFTAALAGGVANGTVVCERATVDSEQSSPFTTADVCLTVESRPDFAASEKTVVDLNGGTVVPGDLLAYTIAATNAGTQAAAGVTITDVVDPSLTEVVPGDGGVYDPGSRTIVWALAGGVPAGGSTLVRFQARVVLPLDDGTPIANQALVACANGCPAPEPTDDPTTPEIDDPTVVRVRSQATLTLHKTLIDENGAPLEPGDAVTWTIVVENTGTACADAVAITDPIDPDVGSVVVDGGGVYDASAGLVTWSAPATPALGRLCPPAPGGTATFTVRAVVDSPLVDGTAVCDQATAASEDLPAPVVSDDPGTPAVGDATCKTVVSGADLTGATKTVVDEDGAPARPGDALTYTIAFANEGNADASGVTVRDRLDPALVDVVPGQGGVLVGGELRWDAATTQALESVPVGETVVLTFTARLASPLDDGTVVANQAEIAAAAGVSTPVVTDDPATPALDDPTAIVVEAHVDLTAQKTWLDENGGVPAPGDTFLYTITLANAGDASARDVRVSDRLEDTLTFVEVLDGGAYAAATRTVAWTVPEVRPGVPAVLRLRAAALPSLASGAEVSNQGAVTIGPVELLTDDPATPAPADPTRFVLVAAPDLQAQKTVSGAAPDGTVGPADSLVYELRIVNRGDGAATEVVVTDPVDTAHLEAVTPLDGGTFDAAASTVTWRPAAIAPGASVVLRFAARVRADVPDGEVIENQAQVACAELGAPVPTDDPGDPEAGDPTEVVARAVPALQVTKGVLDENGAPVAPGDTLRYTIVVAAAGPAHAYDVTVSDPVDGALLEEIVAGDGGVLADGVITWGPAATPALTHVAPGTPVELSFTARVRADAAHGDEVANQALVTARGLTSAVPSDDPATPAAGDPTVVEIVAEPVLEATKTVVDEDGGSVLSGDLLTYTIVVANTGTTAASGATLLDPLPAHTTWVPGSATLNGAAVADVAGGSPLAAPPGLALASPGATDGELTPGAEGAATVVFQVRVADGTALGTVLSNQAFAALPGESPVGSDDPATAARGDPTQLVVGGGALLTSTTKTFDPVPVGDDGDGLFEPGEIVQYRILIQNSGGGPAADVRFVDPVPAGAEYVAGSLRRDGAVLTDPADGDDGEVVGGLVVVRAAELAPGATIEIAFRARVREGATRLENQGEVEADGLAPEATDADGNDANGDQPTVTPIGDAPAFGLLKTVVDLGGGDVGAGDELLYTIELANQGAVDLANVTITDTLPAGLEYVAGSTTWPGPGDPFAGGTVSLPGLAVERGETLAVTFRARVAAAAEGGDSICNLARANVAEDGPFVDSPEACVVVGSIAGTGRLEGRAFLERGERDGTYQADADLALPGLTIRLYQAGERARPAAPDLTTSDDGRYLAPSVPDGDYDVRAFSPTGVGLVLVGGVRIVAGRVTEQDLRIDPSGRLYDATSGAALGGVQVFLHYDEEDATSPGERVPPDLLGPGQQGQVPSADGPLAGAYRFDVRPGHRYRLSVEPGASTWAFPSTLAPPTPGFAPAGPVSPDPDPPAAPDAPRTYYLRFALERPGDDVTNNHVPLDPLSSQVRLDKRADRPEAALGDIVNYTITVQNKSSRDLTAAAGQPVLVRDLPARGLSVLRRHAVAQVARSGAVTRLRAGLEFQETYGTAGSAALVEWGPFDLPAGGTLTLVYQVVVGLDTRQGVYRNRAVLVDAARVHELSNVDSVVLRVDNDPVLDEGVVIGRVFCDRDGDGRPERGERGVLGARVYVDSGSYAVTDDAGKWHLSRLDPGVHLFKLDVATLPPGSRSLGDESQVVFFTRGLATRVDFPVACAAGRAVTQGAPEFTLKLSGRTAAPPPARRAEPPKTSTTITGDLGAMAVAVDGERVEVPAATLEIVLDPALALPVTEGAPNVAAPGPKGWQAPQLVLRGAAAGPTAPERWTIQLWRVEREGERLPVRTLAGAGAPVATPWDGLGDDGKPVARDAVYAAQLRVVFAGGAEAASARAAFGVAFGLPAAERREETLRGKFFRGSDRRPRATRPLERHVAALAGRLGADETIEIEAHGDGTGDKLAALARTGRQADLVKALLVAKGVAPERIAARGRGNADPVAPGGRRADREKNRRLVVRTTPPPPATAGAPVPAAAPGAVEALVAGEPARLDDAGRFVKNVPTPADGRIAVDLVAADGRRALLVIQVPLPPGARPGEGRARPPAAAPRVLGDLASGAISLDGQPLDTALLRIDLALSGDGATGVEPSFTLAKPARRGRGRRARRGAAVTPAKPGLTEPVPMTPRLPPGLEPARWQLTVLRDGGDGEAVLHRIAGEGSPPAVVPWSGEDGGKVLVADGGRYRVRLVVEDARGNLGQSPDRVFTVGTGGRGRFAPIEAAGRLFARKGDPSAALKNRLARLAAQLRRRPGGETYRIEVTIAPPAGADGAGRRLAQAARIGRLKAYLGRLRVPEGRYEIVATLVDEAAPRRQRRDRIRISAIPPPTQVPARVVIDGAEVTLEGTSFTAAPEVPVGGALLLDVTTPGGHRASWSVPVTPAAPGASAGGAAPAEGALPPAADDTLDPFATPDGGVPAAPADPSAGGPGARVAGSWQDLGDDAPLPPGARIAGSWQDLGDDAPLPPGARVAGSWRDLGDDAPLPPGARVAGTWRDLGDADAPLPPGTDVGPRGLGADPDDLLPPGADDLIPWEAAGDRRLDRGPALTLALAGDDEFGGEELEDALADPQAVAPAAGVGAGAPASAPRAAAARGRGATRGLGAARSRASAGVLAADLVVNLPAQGLKLRSPDLWVSGRTNPRNRLRVAGVEARVRRDGTFDHLVTVPAGDSVLVVEATDPDGNVATVSWPVSLSDSEHFLLVLGDGAVSTAYVPGAGGGFSADGAALDGMTDATTTTAGHVLLHGRVAVYYKGRFRGGDLLGRTRVTAHLDTAKRPAFQEFFQEVLDPAKDYAVYGDAATEVRDVNARGKLYVLVEADAGKALVGNFRTGLKGGELFRYDRAIYGAEVDFKKTFGAVKQEAKVFGSAGDERLARDVNLLRATGGSLYYLRHGRIVEGGEQVRVVVRDRDSGLVLLERTLARDVDYVIDYTGGRLMFKEPIASVADATFLLDNLDATQTPLDGHPVYVSVTYEYEVEEGAGGAAGGAYVRDTLFDTLAIGAGIVGESRDDASLGDYRLYGVDAAWRPRKRTVLRAEVAQSQSSDAGNFISMDGGLTYQGLNAVAETVADAGRGTHTAWKLELDTQLGDFVKASWAEGAHVRAYAQELDRGFSAGGTILEQGRTKLGAQASYRLTDRDTLTLRHDAEVALVPRVGPRPEDVAAAADPLALDERASYSTALQWARRGERGDLKVEVGHQALSTTASLAGGGAQVDTHRWGVGALYLYRLSKRLAVRVGQEVQVASTDTDPALAPAFGYSGQTATDLGDPLAGVVTSLGADWKLGSDFTLAGTGALRWNGDTAAQLGLKSALSESASLYVSERLEDRGGRLVTTSVVGGEERFGAARGGKAYGEYQLESGMLGVRNRAVMGVGHRWAALRGLSIAAGYEHQQTFGGYLPDGTPTGQNLRDVVHLGTEYTRRDRLKASALLELRFDDGFHGQPGSVEERFEDLVRDDPRGVTPPGTFADHGGTAPGAPVVIPPGERLQIVAGANASWKWTDDMTFLGRFRLSYTEDVTNHGMGDVLPEAVPESYLVAKLVEATAGWAYRPLEADWLDVLFKYTYLLDQRPVDLEGGAIENRSHILAIAPIVELPLRLRLSSKLAWKRTGSDTELLDGLPLSATVDTLLWLARLGYRFHGNWEVTGEYRTLRLWKPDGAESRHGLLVEVDYGLNRWTRLGIGYNFSRFSDDELRDLERDAHGFFFRVVGRY